MPLKYQSKSLPWVNLEMMRDFIYLLVPNEETLIEFTVGKNNPLTPLSRLLKGQKRPLSS